LLHEIRMLKEVTGDLLLSRAQAIAHGVAPLDGFSSGLALQLRERWPSLYKDFRHYCQTYHPPAGGLWSWMGADGKVVVSLFTQDPPEGQHHGGRPGRASVKHVGHALRELAKLATEEKWKSIAISRLATGVGGLDWKDVQPLLAQHLGALGMPVYVYSTYRAGVQAVES
jgi:O-acetyl-ADP-ribose deacetylase (regulator of RNase III)